jgi:putative methionine-R-sulfoxide reductase with GAF domain
LAEEYRRTDSYVNKVLFLGLSIGFFLALYFDRVNAWLLFGIYPPLFFFISSYSRPGTLLTRITAVFCMISEAYMMYSIADGTEYRTVFLVLPMILLVRYRDWTTMASIPLIYAFFEAFFHLTYHFLDFKWVLDYIDPFNTGRQIAGYGVLGAAWLFCLRLNYVFRQITDKAVFDRINLHERLKNLQDNLLFAKELVVRNFEYDFKIKNTNPLGEALLELRESLIKSIAIERESAFKSEGLARLSATLREKSFDLNLLCQETLLDLSEILKFQLGVFYIANPETKNLHATASKGIPLEKIGTFAAGEGLVGQVYLANRKLILDAIPENYIRIESALGKSDKANLLVVPVKNAGKPIGVLEMIAFHAFTEVELDFIDTVSEIIGSVVDSTIVLQQKSAQNKETS